mgnify:CR=1 FL=1
MVRFSLKFILLCGLSSFVSVSSWAGYDNKVPSLEDLCIRSAQRTWSSPDTSIDEISECLKPLPEACQKKILRLLPLKTWAQLFRIYKEEDPNNLKNIDYNLFFENFQSLEITEKESESSNANFPNTQTPLKKLKANEDVIRSLKETLNNEKMEIEKSEGIWKASFSNILQNTSALEAGTFEEIIKEGLFNIFSLESSDLGKTEIRALAESTVKELTITNLSSKTFSEFFPSRSSQDNLFPNLLSLTISSDENRAESASFLDSKGIFTITQRPYFENLIHLNVRNNEINSRGAFIIARDLIFQNLKYLNLGGNPIYKEGNMVISKSTTLKKITHLILFSWC